MTTEKQIAALQSKTARQRNENARLEQIISRLLNEKIEMLKEIRYLRAQLDERK